MVPVVLQFRISFFADGYLDHSNDLVLEKTIEFPAAPFAGMQIEATEFRPLGAYFDSVKPSPIIERVRYLLGEVVLWAQLTHYVVRGKEEAARVSKFLGDHGWKE